MKMRMIKKMINASVGLMLFFTTVSAWPLTPTEVAKLIASDGMEDDLFGWSVAVHGDTAVIGTNRDPDLVMTGRAYVFVHSGTGWSEQAKLITSDGAPGASFGWSVTVHGDTAVVGASEDDDNGTGSGAAYVFVRNGVSWSEQAKLTASDATTYGFFGRSVAVHGDTAVIGASENDDNGTNSGAAYVFVRSGASWSEQTKLTASDAAAHDSFGNSVAVHGDTVVIGASGNDDNGTDSGAAYIFVRSGASWSEQAKLTASDAAANDHFGRSAVHGDTVVIGASGNDDNGTDSGAAYIFVRSGASWSEQAKLTASDAAANDHFGRSAVHGDTVVIGAPGNNDNGSYSGAAYCFVRNGASWGEQAKLTASDAAAQDFFGNSVAVHGDTALIGAYGKEGNGREYGAAYVFSCADVAITEYAAKLVCGPQHDPKNLRLVRGLYGTAINIHNPGEQPTTFKKKLALTFPPDEQKPGKVYDIALDKLGPGEALEVDCMDIKRKLFPDGFPQAYIKGFVIIQSDSPLNVTAVYTAAGLDKKDHVTSVTSIDVEKIPGQNKGENRPHSEQCPDLVVSEIGKPVVECRGWFWRTCATTVDYTIVNIGNAAAGPFTVKAIFDPSQSVIVNKLISGGLAAGAEQSITITTPGDGSCFDPDCTISVTADSNNDVEECNEANNKKSETTSG